MSQTAKNVVIPLFEGVEVLDVTGPAAVFATANDEAGHSHYGLHYLCDEPRGWVRSSSDLELRGAAPSALPDTVHTLLVPGAEAEFLFRAMERSALLSTIAAAAKRSERCSSVCSGAFLLGALGLLDGRRVATHWAGEHELRTRHPDACVLQDRLFQRDGDLWTSAGVLSGVDMALAMVQEDLGAAVSLGVARRMVVFLVRDGGQAQFSAPINLQGRASDSDLGELVSWLQHNLREPVTVESMANRIAVSVRTLHRRCKIAFDMTPAQVLSELRLERARSFLHNASIPVKRIAFECGFASQAALSKAFAQRFGVSPTHYRQRFRAETDSRASS